MSDADDDRPRPQYGEYATPEEQLARIRVPDASASLAAGAAPTAPRPAPARPAAVSAQRLSVDRILTIGLLGIGLYNVIAVVPRFLDYPTFVQQYLDSAGVDATFTAVDAGRTWGLVSAILFAALWFLTAILSVLRLRRGRLAFWIPLVGALVAFVVVGACLAVPLLDDPALVDVLVPTPTVAP